MFYRLKVIFFSFLDITVRTQTISKLKTYKATGVEKIPVRATLFSALATLPYFIGLVRTLVFQQHSIERGNGIKIMMYIILVVRCPLTALITFASNRKH